MAIMTVPIAHTEEVRVTGLDHVRIRQKCILVRFEWLVWRDATLRSKGELCYDVADGRRLGFVG